MDLYLKQWRNQHESEQQPSAKMPKLLDPQHQQLPLASALPLFVPEPASKLSNLSAFPDSNTASSRFPKMGSYFSLAQWQELELQASIFRYMLAGAAVPHELLQNIKKSLHSPAFFLHHPLQHFSRYQPSLMQAGYWGRVAMDPEPGRCRRTDGKKWRCSRDVMAGHKYCERHMHRGRNRSRKPVEIPTPTTTATTSVTGGGGAAAGALKTTALVAASPMSGGSHFSLSGSSASIDLFHINQSSTEPKHDNNGLFEPQNEVDNSRSDGHILRHFFDDWPRKLQESDQSNSSPMNSATGLTISMPGNLPSDVSLKLSTGIGDEPGGSRRQNVEQQQQHRLNWPTGWATNNVASMGGPLAEALRSSTSTSSPTSVLHQLQPRGSASETSFVSI